MLFRCTRHGHPPYYLEWEDPNGDGVCPKCGSTANVIELVYIHFIAMGSGPIMGHFGAQHVACEPKRDGLAMHIHDDFHASDDPRITSCPSCLTTKEWLEFAQFTATTDKVWAAKLRKYLAQKG